MDRTNFKSFIILIVFVTVFKLVGCSDQSNNSDHVKDTVDKSISDFKNRPIHRFLTEHIIDTTPDDKLLQVVFDNLTEKLPEDYKKEYQTVLSWSKPRQAVYMIWWLEAEVNNGGYNQFYVNSSGQYYKLVPGALELIGANKFAKLTERANKVYEQENDRITKHQDGTTEGFGKSYENNPLNKFDGEFYALYETEKLQKLQVDFIRKHKTEFIDE